MSVGILQLILILLIIILLFGAKRIPNIMNDLGRSFKYFKKGIEEDSEKNKKESDNNEKGN